MTARTIVAIVAALLVGVQVVRNATVHALAETRPEAAARAWSAHPQTETGVAMTDIASATRARRPVPPSAFAQVADVAVKDPLAPEPFLVRGVQAGLAGDGAAAQRAFEAAQWRDPRSQPAAYFLADRYLRSGDVVRGVHEVATLSRISRDGTAAATPYFAQYAANPATWPTLRALFAKNPVLAQNVLMALASNAQTVPAALAISGSGDPRTQSWLPVAVNTLVSAGNYAAAREAWTRLAGPSSQPGELLHDAAFQDSMAPPPFNWQLTSSTVGLAERQTGKRLHVVFYGDEDGTLASELLLLAPGAYRLSLRLAGDPKRAHALTWALWCDKAPQPLASVTLDVAASRGWQFEVPSGCSAQWLKLSGISSDIPQQVDIGITDLRLTRGSPGA